MKSLRFTAFNLHIQLKKNIEHWNKIERGWPTKWAVNDISFVNSVLFHLKIRVVLQDPSNQYHIYMQDWTRGMMKLTVKKWRNTIGVNIFWYLPAFISFILSVFSSLFLFYSFFFLFLSLFSLHSLSNPCSKTSLYGPLQDVWKSFTMKDISSYFFFQLFFNCLCIKTWVRNTCVLPTL